MVALVALAVAGVVAWLLLRGGGALGPADSQGAEVERIEIDSEAVGRPLPVSVVTPDGAGDERRPLLVFLHRRGGDEDDALIEEMYAALEDAGKRAPVIAFPYGGETSYWHDRADGDWGRYVAEEVVARIAEEFPVDPERVGIGGISMGGFGALNLARVYPDTFCAAAGHSPALWRSAGETAPGAFDDPADFARNDVIAAAFTKPASFEGREVWLDSGDSDPFVPGIDALRTAIERAGTPLTAKTFDGGHEGEYWDAHWDDYMEFYARALADC